MGNKPLSHSISSEIHCCFILTKHPHTTNKLSTTQSPDYQFFLLNLVLSQTLTRLELSPAHPQLVLTIFFNFYNLLYYFEQLWKRCQKPQVVEPSTYFHIFFKRQSNKILSLHQYYVMLSKMLKIKGSLTSPLRLSNNK